MSAIVHLELRIDPAQLERAQAVLIETLTATRAWPGNEGLEVVVDDADPTHLIVVEHWATAADHAAYAEWRTTPEGVSGLGEIVAAPPVKTVFSEQIELGL